MNIDEFRNRWYGLTAAHQDAAALCDEVERQADRITKLEAENAATYAALVAAAGDGYVRGLENAIEDLEAELATERGRIKAAIALVFRDAAFPDRRMVEEAIDAIKED